MKLKIDSIDGIYLVAETIQDKVYIYELCKNADTNFKQFLNIDFKENDIAGMSSIEDYIETEEREQKYRIESITGLEISIYSI